MMTTEAPDGTTPASGKNRWFQVGLLSAGAVAPLIARWRSLRAEEQAESLRDQASARWSAAVARVAASLPTESLEYFEESLRQVSSAARDAWQRLPGVSAPEPEPPAPVAPVARRRGSATIWLIGVGVGVVAAGVIAYIVLRNRLGAASDDDTLVEIPLTSPALLATNGATPAEAAQAAQAASAATAASDAPAITTEPPDEEPGVANPIAFSESDAEGAAFIGNILSRVYHPMDSKRLPSPQNRIYFASEAEALSAGYRPDSAELASHTSDIAETGE